MSPSRQMTSYEPRPNISSATLLLCLAQICQWIQDYQAGVSIHFGDEPTFPNDPR